MLSFPEGTLFGYLPNVEFFNNPKLKVNSISKNKIELTADNGSIAWHYILAPVADAPQEFVGFKYDSEFNMWKNADVFVYNIWFADNNWGTLPDQPVINDFTNAGFSITTPAGMGTNKWTGQVHLHSDIDVSADEFYDFSVFIDTPVDADITVKVQKLDDDGVYFTEDSRHFTAGGSCYFFTNQRGFDGKFKIVFDFAGYPETEFAISNIVFKKHSDDDGTVLPQQ